MRTDGDEGCAETTPRQHKQIPCGVTPLCRCYGYTYQASPPALPPPPFHSTPPPTRLNPIQPNSGIRPASPPRLLRSRTSCWQIRLHSPVPPLSPFPPHPLRPPAPSLSIHPSSATTHSPLLLPPPPHTHPLSPSPYCLSPDGVIQSL